MSSRLGRTPKRYVSKKAQTPIGTATADAPGTGPVRIYLDDERPCPEGWILARSEARFWKLVDQAAGRITHMSLDWHLGTGLPDGEAIAIELASRMRTSPDAFSSLSYVGFHSSDRKKAAAMLRTIEDVLQDDDALVPFFATRIGRPPQETGRNARTQS